MKFLRSSNKIEEFAKFAVEELKRVNKKHPLFEGMELEEKNIQSFIVAQICFEMAVNPNLKLAKIKPEYKELIEEEKNKEAVGVFYKHMMNYYEGIPNLDKALHNLTSTYLTICWSASEEKLHDAAFLLAASMHMTQLRVLIKNYLEGFLMKEIVL